MRPLRFHINVTLDGCCDHRAGIADEETHRHAAEIIAGADALIFGRVTYQMMEAAWRPPWPEGRAAWTKPFAEAIDRAKKYVVSQTLAHVDWNAELVQGDLRAFVTALKEAPGGELFVGGTQLARALTELGLIDVYDVIVHPRFAGHGPTLFAGLSREIDLRLVDRREFVSGVVAMRYELKR